MLFRRYFTLPLPPLPCPLPPGERINNQEIMLNYFNYINVELPLVKKVYPKLICFMLRPDSYFTL